MSIFRCPLRINGWSRGYLFLSFFYLSVWRFLQGCLNQRLITSVSIKPLPKEKWIAGRMIWRQSNKKLCIVLLLYFSAICCIIDEYLWIEATVCISVHINRNQGVCFDFYLCGSAIFMLTTWCMNLVSFFNFCYLSMNLLSDPCNDKLYFQNSVLTFCPWAIVSCNETIS